MKKNDEKASVVAKSQETVPVRLHFKKKIAREIHGVLVIGLPRQVAEDLDENSPIWPWLENVFDDTAQGEVDFSLIQWDWGGADDPRMAVTLTDACPLDDYPRPEVRCVLDEYEKLQMFITD
jgi:hypothetical protein